MCKCGDRVRTNSGRLVFLHNSPHVVLPPSSPANIYPISKAQLEPHSLGGAFGPRRPRGLPDPELPEQRQVPEMLRPCAVRTGSPRHRWLLRTGPVARATKELDFKFI